MSKVKPIRGRVLVKRDPEPQTYKGTCILLPDQCKEKPQTGTVVDVNEGYVNLSGNFISTTLTPGVKVVFPKNVGVDLKEIEPGLFVVREEDILLAIEKVE